MSSEERVAFSVKMDTVVASGYLTVGLAIGQELGLFTAMADLDKASTSREIAAKVGCKERLVREWLHQMVAAEIVDLDETGAMYCLPEDRRAAVQSSIAGTACLLPYLLSPHKQLMEAFKENGPAGLTRPDCRPFCNMWEGTRPGALAALLPKGIALIEGLHEKLDSGIKVLDIGAGRGHLCRWLAAKYPNSEITGVDIVQESVDESTALATKEGLTNVQFEVQDASALPQEWEEQFDLVTTFDVIHDLPYASKAISEVYRVLKKEGWYLVQEMYAHSDPRDNRGNPFPVVFCVFSLYHCLSKALTAPDSEGLGTCAGVETFRALLQTGGFDIENKGVEKRINEHEIMFACKK